MRVEGAAVQELLLLLDEYWRENPELQQCESMSLKYEPSSEPLHISVKWLFSPILI